MARGVHALLPPIEVVEASYCNANPEDRREWEVRISFWVSRILATCSWHIGKNCACCDCSEALVSNTGANEQRQTSQSCLPFRPKPAGNLTCMCLLHLSPCAVISFLLPEGAACTTRLFKLCCVICGICKVFGTKNIPQQACCMIICQLQVGKECQ